MKTMTIHQRFALAVALAVFMALFLGQAPALTQSPAETITLVLHAPAYQIVRQEGRTRIEAEGYGLANVTGEYQLPHRLIDVALPPDVAWDTLALSVRDAQTVPVPGTHRIAVAEPDRSTRGHTVPAVSPQVPDIARIVATGQLRKWHVARVDFNPFRYNPATGQLDVVRQVTVELRLARGKGLARPEELGDTVMDEVAAQQFVNYASAAKWYPAADQPNVTYDYVIITTNAIESGSSKLAPFVAHKQSKGYRVLVVTEDDYGGLTGQAPNGRAEKVRKWLQNNYVTYKIKYVLLIGDPTPVGTGATDLPMEKCWPRRGSGSDEDSPTDYFFADLTGDWDKDADQYYGEFSGDWGVTGGVDFFPEVFVGRIPFYDNYTDLNDILQKIMDYANETNTAWRKSILMPMSYSADGYDGAPLAEQMWADYLNAAGYTRWRQYQQGSSVCPAANSAYPSDQELRGNTIVRDRWGANDYGIVAWWGHGSQTEAAVGYEGCWDGTLFNNTQTGALDDDHPAFTYQCSCTNGYPENTANLQYAVLKRGGIATVSASRVSWFNTDVGYGEFDGSTTNSGIGYEYVHRVVDGQTAGEALYNAKSGMTPESSTRLMNYYDFNLYGDPATRITDQAGYRALVPAVMANNAPWTTLLNETFESTFPGVWNVFDNDGSTNGEYKWAKRNCRAFAGSYSGWGVGGGANGGALACGSNYPNNAASWMVHGPFSLAGATAADLKFMLWLNSENGYDYIMHLASINGTNFHGYGTSGNTGGWIDRTLDLTTVPTLGNLMGQPNVWIALVFSSNASTNYAEGAHVDNIVLRKCSATACSSPAGPATGPAGGNLIERPVTVTRSR